jgi:glycosyltransferase involved in cell wall biosynthesis
MLSSKPVLVSRDCGVSEIVNDGQNALLINGADPLDIANKIKVIFKSPRQSQIIGNNAKKFVKKNISWDGYAKNMFLEFKKLIEGAPHD